MESGAYYKERQVYRTTPYAPLPIHHAMRHALRAMRPNYLPAIETKIMPHYLSLFLTNSLN